MGSRYSPELKAKILALALEGRSPNSLAAEYPPTHQAIRNWLKAAKSEAAGQTKSQETGSQETKNQDTSSQSEVVNVSPSQVKGNGKTRAYKSRKYRTKSTAQEIRAREAKRESEAILLRQGRRAVRNAKERAILTTGRTLSGNALTNVAGADLARQRLKEALDAVGWNLETHTKALWEMTQATKWQTVNKEALETRDNDASLRAMEMLGKLLGSAGCIPPPMIEEGPRGGAAVVRFVQAGPDGQETVIEIGVKS